MSDFDLKRLPFSVAPARAACSGKCPPLRLWPCHNSQETLWQAFHMTGSATRIKAQVPNRMRHKRAGTTTASTMRDNSTSTTTNLHDLNVCHCGAANPCFASADNAMFPAKQPWRVPRQVAGHYAGYTDVLAKLYDCLLEPQSRNEQVVCVLSGMGGVGKSSSVAVSEEKQQCAPKEVSVNQHRRACACTDGFLGSGLYCGSTAAARQSLELTSKVSGIFADGP